MTCKMVKKVFHVVLAMTLVMTQFVGLATFASASDEELPALNTVLWSETATDTVGSAAASVSVVSNDYNIEAEESYFDVVLSYAANLKSISFQVDLPDGVESVVECAAADFTLSASGDSYVLDYLPETMDLLDSTGTDIVLATISVHHPDLWGVSCSLSYVYASQEVGGGIGASSEAAYALYYAKKDKVAEIDAALATFDETKYYADDWATLVAIFDDGSAEVNEMTNITDVTAYDVDALVALANEIMTIKDINVSLYDFNNDGEVDIVDITCMSEYFGHTVTDENMQYDASNDESITSADYLIVFMHMT